MSEQTETASKLVRSVYAPLVWCAVCVVFIVWSYDLDEVSRAAPLMGAYAGLVLGILDLLSRFRGGVADVIRMTMGAGFSNPEIAHDPQWSDEARQMAWMTFFVVMVLFVGILPAVPAYVLLSMRMNGGRSWKESIIAAVATFAFVFVVFEIFLSFELYRGVLFDERGFDKW